MTFCSIRAARRPMALLAAPLFAGAAFAGLAQAAVRESLQRPAEGYRYLLTERAGDAVIPRVVLVITGGDGVLNLAVSEAREVIAAPGAENRARLAEAVGAVATLDMETPIDFEARFEPAHANRLVAVAQSLRARFPAAGLYVYGLSNGAVSAGALAVRNAVPLAGVVFVSSSSSALNREVLDPIKAPILIVHHKRDSCTEWRYVMEIAKWYPTLLVDDPQLPPPMGARDCGAGSAHQFGRKRTEVQAAIIEWINTGKTVTAL